MLCLPQANPGWDAAYMRNNKKPANLPKESPCYCNHTFTVRDILMFLLTEKSFINFNYGRESIFTGTHRCVFSRVLLLRRCVRGRGNLWRRLRLPDLGFAVKVGAAWGPSLQSLPKLWTGGDYFCQEVRASWEASCASQGVSALQSFSEWLPLKFGTSFTITENKMRDLPARLFLCAMTNGELMCFLHSCSYGWAAPLVGREVCHPKPPLLLQPQHHAVLLCGSLKGEVSIYKRLQKGNVLVRKNKHFSAVLPRLVRSLASNLCLSGSTSSSLKP